VHIVGEAKSPDALRNASDQFFEWVKPEPVEPEPTPQKTTSKKAVATKSAAAKPLPKQRPKMVADAVVLLGADTSEGKVSISSLGSYLKRADPSFTPKKYGHATLLSMLKTYDLLKLQQGPGEHWFVQAQSVGQES
jgi:hypothetical protein